MLHYFGGGWRVMAEKKSVPGRKKTVKKGNSSRRPVNVQPLDSLLGFHIRLAMVELRRSYFRHVADGAIRPGIASLLQFVAANPGTSQVKLSRAMHIDKASLVSLLNQAESAGWLTRSRSKADRRRHELVLTAEGESIANKLRKQTLRHEKRFIDRFSSSELERLVEYLKRIYD